MIFSIAFEAIVVNGRTIETTIADTVGRIMMSVTIVAVMTTMMMSDTPKKKDVTTMMMTIFDIEKVAAIAMSMKTMTIATTMMTNRSAPCEF
jgi:hypothetical protein